MRKTISNFFVLITAVLFMAFISMSFVYAEDKKLSTNIVFAGENNAKVALSSKCAISMGADLATGSTTLNEFFNNNADVTTNFSNVVPISPTTLKVTQTINQAQPQNMCFQIENFSTANCLKLAIIGLYINGEEVELEEEYYGIASKAGSSHLIKFPLRSYYNITSTATIDYILEVTETDPVFSLKAGSTDIYSDNQYYDNSSYKVYHIANGQLEVAFSSAQNVDFTCTNHSSTPQYFSLINYTTTSGEVKQFVSETNPETKLSNLSNIKQVASGGTASITVASTLNAKTLTFKVQSALPQYEILTSKTASADYVKTNTTKMVSSTNSESVSTAYGSLLMHDTTKFSLSFTYTADYKNLYFVIANCNENKSLRLQLDSITLNSNKLLLTDEYAVVVGKSAISLPLKIALQDIIQTISTNDDITLTFNVKETASRYSLEIGNQAGATTSFYNETNAVKYNEVEYNENETITVYGTITASGIPNSVSIICLADNVFEIRTKIDKETTYSPTAVFIKLNSIDNNNKQISIKNIAAANDYSGTIEEVNIALQGYSSGTYGEVANITGISGNNTSGAVCVLLQNGDEGYADDFSAIIRKNTELVIQIEINPNI